MHRKLGFVGQIRPNGLFQMGQLRRIQNVTAKGLWSYPALIAGPQGQHWWLHLAMSAEYFPAEVITRLYGLEAKAITSSNSTVLLYYQDFRGGDPYPHETRNITMTCHYPHKNIRKLSYAELVEKEKELLLFYPIAEEYFFNSKPLPQSFVSLYMSLTHTSFLKYIRSETPDFYFALKKQEVNIKP